MNSNNIEKQEETRNKTNNLLSDPNLAMIHSRNLPEKTLPGNYENQVHDSEL